MLPPPPQPASARPLRRERPQVTKNKIRGVNMRNFGYGGEDAYFYCQGK
jgi:hypothetical protein